METLAIRIVATADVELARRDARAVAVAVGCGPQTTECVVLAAAELATNLVRYAPGGDLRITRLPAPRPGVLLESEDRGPGIPDLAAARRDGFSTSTGLGSGLGAVERLMDESEFRSSPAGTTIAARKWADAR